MLESQYVIEKRVRGPVPRESRVSPAIPQAGYSETNR